MAIRIRQSIVKALALALVLAAIGAAVVFTLRGSEPHTKQGSGSSKSLSEWNAEKRTILWVVRSKDLLSCRTAGSVLRRTLQSREDSVSLTLVAVEVDSAWAASLLRTERLNGSIRIISERQYRRDFGESVTPMLYVLNYGKVLTAIHVPREAAEDSIRERLVRVLNATAVFEDGKPS